MGVCVGVREGMTEGGMEGPRVGACEGVKDGPPVGALVTGPRLGLEEGHAEGL